MNTAARVIRILREAKRIAREYYNVTRRPLGVTGDPTRAALDGWTLVIASALLVGRGAVLPFYSWWRVVGRSG